MGIISDLSPFEWFTSSLHMINLQIFISGDKVGWFGWFKVFNTTFNNISVISWRSVLLVEETGVPRENGLHK
jgi:hypothetical protein